MKKLLCKILLPLCCAVSLMLFVACENEGPAEKAGEKLDEAIENTQDVLKDAGEKMKDAVKEGGEKLEETGEKLQN